MVDLVRTVMIKPDVLDIFQLGLLVYTVINNRFVSLPESQTYIMCTNHGLGSQNEADFESATIYMSFVAKSVSESLHYSTAQALPGRPRQGSARHYPVFYTLSPIFVGRPAAGCSALRIAIMTRLLESCVS